MATSGACVAGQGSCYGQDDLLYGHSSCLCHSRRCPAMPTRSGWRFELLLGHQGPPAVQQCCIPVPCRARRHSCFVSQLTSAGPTPRQPNKASLAPQHCTCPALQTGQHGSAPPAGGHSAGCAGLGAIHPGLPPGRSGIQRNALPTGIWVLGAGWPPQPSARGCADLQQMSLSSC